MLHPLYSVVNVILVHQFGRQTPSLRDHYRFVVDHLNYSMVHPLIVDTAVLFVDFDQNLADCSAVYIKGLSIWEN